MSSALSAGRVLCLSLTAMAPAAAAAQPASLRAGAARIEPLEPTIMVTHANGAIGYIPDDDAYDQVSYEITSTRLKRGCAESAIVNGLLDLMRGN